MNAMKINKKRIVSRKVIITFLLIISLIMTSGTFAFWADSVEGSNINVQSSFSIGSFNFINHEFVLDDNENTTTYLVPTDYLLENPDENISELVFGVQCLFDNSKEQCEVEFEYEIIVMKDGVVQSAKRTTRYGSLINLEEIEIPTGITDDTVRTVKLNLSLFEENRRNDYRNLPRFDIYIKIDMDIKYD